MLDPQCEVMTQTGKTLRLFFPIWIMGYVSGLVSPRLELKCSKSVIINILVLIFKFHSVITVIFYLKYIIDYQLSTVKEFFPRFTLCLHLLTYVGTVITITILGFVKNRELIPLLKKILRTEKQYKIPAHNDKRLKKTISAVIFITVSIWLSRLAMYLTFRTHRLPIVLIILYDTCTVKIIEAFFATVSAVFVVIWHHCYSINESLRSVQSRQLYFIKFVKNENQCDPVQNLGEIYLELIHDAEEFNHLISICLLSAIACVSVVLFVTLYYGIFLFPREEEKKESLLLVLSVFISCLVHVTVTSLICQITTIESRRTGKVFHEALGNENNPLLMKKVILKISVILFENR